MEDEGEIEVNAKGVMVLHRDGCGDEYYEITKIPSDATFLVQQEKKDILKNLGLQSVLTELNQASDLLYLAYMGVVGTGELHARISNRQMELSKLCAECTLTMTKLEVNSRLVLQRLMEAYKYLLKANEPRALRILSRCAENAGEVSASCAKLADGFGKLLDDTKEDAATAARVLGKQNEKMKQLEALRDKMQATKLKREVQSKLFTESIQKMEAEIKDEKDRQALADKRAFISLMVGRALNAVTLGHSNGPFQPGSSSSPSGGEGDSNRKGRRRKTTKVNARKVVEDAKSAETEAAESLDSITQPADQMSQAQEIASNGMKIYAEKLKLEALHRESMGHLAELTSLLEVNSRETSVEESAQVALEIAGIALQNVFVAISNAKLFWDKMKMICEDLVKSSMVEQIEDELKDKLPPEKRIEFYKSEDFVDPAVRSVAKWAALTSVCGEYVKATELTRQSVLNHIRAAPSMEEAKLQIGPLKARLHKEYMLSEAPELTLVL